MNQSQASDDAAPHEPPHHEQGTGPRATREQILDVSRLRRSSSDKYIGGVAGGLGRHLDIDPLIVRVVFAVTALFGVGILLYVAFWLLLPDEADHAPIHTEPETRKVLVLVAVGIAAVLFLGIFLGESNGILWALLLFGGLAVYAVSRRPATGPYRDAGPVGQTAVPGAPRDTLPTEPVGPAHTSAMYNPPPRPRRTGTILFWPTLALLAMAMGSLALYDLDHVVADGAYPALAITLVGLMLVVGAFVGRAGGLILLGLLLIPPLAISSVIGNDLTHVGVDMDERPATAAAVRSHYNIGTGRLHLDLTALPPDQLAALDGRRITLDMKAGETVLVLPTGLAHDVDAELSLAGEVQIDDRVVSGTHPRLSETVPAVVDADGTDPSITVHLDGVAGRIEVRTNGAPS